MHTHRLSLLACFFSLAAPCGAELASERWGAEGTPCTHAGTLEAVQEGEVTRLVFDLSPIPRDARVLRASLACFTREGAQPRRAPLVYAGQREEAGGQPLELEPPWYRSFDASQAVARWVRDPARNPGFVVTRFDGLLAERSTLEVVYEGRPRDVPDQAHGLRAVHHDGQTFVVWREHSAFRPQREDFIWVRKFVERGDELADGPGEGAHGLPSHPAITLRTLRGLQGLGLRDKPSGFQGIRPLERVRQVPAITYRVYRHSERITAANIGQAERIAEVEPLSGLDKDVYRIHFKGEYLDQWEDPDSPIPTYCVARGEPLAHGEGLYVHTPHQPGRAYYAVTTALGGTENLAQVGEANSLAEPVDEQPATPQPVLQWMQEDRYRKETPEGWYRYWAAPPYANLPGGSYRVAMAVGPEFQEPGPLSIGSISGTFNVRESIRVPPPDRVTFLVERQLHWLPALFYNEGRGTLRGASECRVDYFSERYMLFMIQWVMGRYRIDRSRITGGLLHFGLRHPEIFTRMSFGRYTATYDYRIAPGGPRMPTVLGPRGIETTRGEDAWKMYSVAEYVKAYPGRDIPFLLCISGTGKDRGHTSEFGWQDDPRGWAGLAAARQPFVASWSLQPPRDLTQAFDRMRWDVSLPAFSNCSLDNNPGNGDPADGDYYGCINGWLLWSDTEQTDQPDRWEITVWVINSCPEDACTVDVTPRRCRRFRPDAGDRVQWSNTSLATGKVVQQGHVVTDRWGRVTLEGVRVDKARNRIRIAR
ncbi:MAG: hypothetical protein ACLF0G_03875 [Candidatus Brocadiia bacterium]